MTDILARIDATIAACESNPFVEFVELNLPDVRLEAWQRDIHHRWFSYQPGHMVVFDEVHQWMAGRAE